MIWALAGWVLSWALAWLLGIDRAVAALHQRAEPFRVCQGTCGAAHRAHVAAQERTQHVAGRVLQPVRSEDGIRLSVVLAEAAKHERRAGLSPV